MRIVIQRVKEASVSVNSECIAEINEGLLVLVGFTEGDTEENINYMVKKITELRIFNDRNGFMNLSVTDIKGSILSVSQFTLYADTKKGRRPSFDKSLNKDEALKLYEIFNNKLRETNLDIKTGCFGEKMEVNLINDGPVTIIIDSRE
ncbi:MAG: D-aminoacyl-tRNA deacylase [Bacilli bacterium]|nr:D-aminoacyl-tRNA deacylase [Bacilli bacterium]